LTEKIIKKKKLKIEKEKEKKSKGSEEDFFIPKPSSLPTALSLFPLHGMLSLSPIYTKRIDIFLLQPSILVISATARLSFGFNH
jgi:hypothetical protein